MRTPAIESEKFRPFGLAVVPCCRSRANLCHQLNIFGGVNLRTVGAGLLSVVLLIISGCTTVEPNTGEVAQVQTGASPGSTELPLVVAVGRRDRNSEDLARVLSQAEERTVALDRLTAPVTRRGLAEDAAVVAVCGALGQVVPQGPALTRELLFRIIFGYLVVSFRGDQIAALAAGQGLVNELSDGTANDPVWARAALSKSEHCSPRKSWTDSSTAG